MEQEKELKNRLEKQKEEDQVHDLHHLIQVSRADNY